MNDNALSVAGASGRNASSIGLPEKLVQDGLIDEAAMADAQRVARDARQNLVSYLSRRASSRRARSRSPRPRCSASR
jgi:hypothetical protein